MNEIIAIASQKGGVGKTALTRNLGYELSLLNLRVLMIDFDPQGDLTKSVGLSLTEKRPTVYKAMKTPQEAKKCIVHLGENLDLLPADINLSGAEIEFTIDPYIDRNERLQHALEPLVDEYDYILIDAPPSLGFFTCNAFVACTGVIVPLQCERLAQMALDSLLEIMNKFLRRNNDLRLTGIVLTFYDKRVKVSQEIEEETRQKFKHVVFDTMIPRNIAIMKAMHKGAAASQNDPKSAGAMAYRALAMEVLNV